MNNPHALAIIAVSSGVTILLRFLPFEIFGKGRETPALVQYLGKVLPYSIMGMLVVFCLRSSSVFSDTHAIPEICACLGIALVQWWKRNTMLSILIGTVIYMVLVQKVF